MGGLLATQHGADYLNIGQAFSSGAFNAVGMTPSGGFTSLQAFNLGAAVPGSIEALFGATTVQRAIFDTRQIPAGGDAAAPLAYRLTMRNIGASFSATASPAVYQSPVALPGDYDLVVWFRGTSASRLSLGLPAMNQVAAQVDEGLLRSPLFPLPPY
jgi:erythromycin esterase-like protein